MTTQPAIGLLLGDPAGIGPQLAVRLLAEPLPPQVKLIVVGRRAWLGRGAQQARLPEPDLPAVALTDLDQAPIDCPILLETEGGDLDQVPVASVSREAGASCMASLRTAADLVARDLIAGFLYGPMHKQSLHLGGSRHPDDAALLTEPMRSTSSTTGVRRALHPIFRCLKSLPGFRLPAYWQPSNSCMPSCRT